MPDNIPSAANAARAAEILAQEILAFARLTAFPNDTVFVTKGVAKLADAFFEHVGNIEGVDGWDSVVSDAIEGDLLYLIEGAVERGLPVERSDADEHSTLNRAQQGIGRAA